jgi:hypothetical protein
MEASIYFGDTDYVDADDTEWSGLANGNDFTVSTWFQVPAGETQVYCPYSYMGSGAGNDYFGVAFYVSSGFVEADLIMWDGNGTSKYIYKKNTSIGWTPDGRWAHGAITFDYSDRGNITCVRGWINGVECTEDGGNNVDTGLNYTTPDILPFGNYYYGARQSGRYQAQAHWELWKRILTDNEILELASGKVAPFEPAVHLWDFGRIADRMGNLTMTNGSGGDAATIISDGPPVHGTM